MASSNAHSSYHVNLNIYNFGVQTNTFPSQQYWSKRQSLPPSSYDNRGDSRHGSGGYTQNHGVPQAYSMPQNVSSSTRNNRDSSSSYVTHDRGSPGGRSEAPLGVVNAVIPQSPVLPPAAAVLPSAAAAPQPVAETAQRALPRQQSSQPHVSSSETPTASPASATTTSTPKNNMLQNIHKLSTGMMRNLDSKIKHYFPVYMAKAEEVFNKTSISTKSRTKMIVQKAKDLAEGAVI